MPGIGNLNLKVVLYDSDYYALQAVNSYLAWDRRTRVTFLAESLPALWNNLQSTTQAELPDVVVLAVDQLGTASALSDVLQRMQRYVADAHVVCLAQEPDTAYVRAAAEAGASAFLLKHEVRLQIAWAIVYALERDFVVTHSVARAAEGMFDSRVFHASVLPDQREYPELTDRIRQAIKLCVVEGMPAHLAADEMGISLHTIRGYIKEGYRILETYDETEYPVDMTPQERAFMRFTALAQDDEDDA